jgi:hypothetical protein
MKFLLRVRNLERPGSLGFIYRAGEQVDNNHHADTTVTILEALHSSLLILYLLVLYSTVLCERTA